jgi:hypothetical protein
MSLPFVQLPGVAQLLGMLVNAHRQAFSFGREHAPRTVAVPKEKQSNRSCRQH